MFRRRRAQAVDETAKPDRGPDVTPHEEFTRQNGEWNKKVEESFSELEKLAGEEPLPEKKTDESAPPA